MSKQAVIDAMTKRKQDLEKKDLTHVSEADRMKILIEITEIGNCLLVLKRGKKNETRRK